MPHPLAGATLQRIQEAQRVLLDPLRHTSLADCQHAAAAQAQAVMEADCAYSILPREEGLALAGVNVDAPFLEGTRDSCSGIEIETRTLLGPLLGPASVIVGTTALDRAPPMGINLVSRSELALAEPGLMRWP